MNLNKWGYAFLLILIIFIYFFIKIVSYGPSLSTLVRLKENVPIQYDAVLDEIKDKKYRFERTTEWFEKSMLLAEIESLQKQCVEFAKSYNANNTEQLSITTCTK